MNDSGGHFEDVSVYVSSCLISHDRFYFTTNLLQQELLVVYRVYEEISRGVNLLVSGENQFFLKLTLLYRGENSVFKFTKLSSIGHLVAEI